MHTFAHTKVVEHLLWIGNRDYEHTVRNLIPLVPRNAVIFEEILELIEGGDTSLGGPAALQELVLRLFPDRIGTATLERWYKKSRTRVREQISIILESHYRSPFAQLRSMIIEAQGELSCLAMA